MRISQLHAFFFLFLVGCAASHQVSAIPISESSATAWGDTSKHGLKGNGAVVGALAAVAVTNAWNPVGWAAGIASLFEGLSNKAGLDRIRHNRVIQTGNQLAHMTKNLHIADMALDIGFNSRVAQKPILEVLYAWLGYDQWESYGASYHIRMKYNWKKAKKDHIVTFDSNYQPITDKVSAPSYQDITPLIQGALKQNGTFIYIPRMAPCIIAPQGDSGDMRPGNIAKHSITTAGSYALYDPRYHHIGAIPAPVMPSNVNEAQLPDGKTVGIVYRDADGIHFRRFEGWQNIALPMVSSMKLCKNSQSQNCNGGFVYGHQFEEIGRGLITATIKGPGPLNILATDRFGWANTFHDGKTFCPGVYVPTPAIGADLYLLWKRNDDKVGWFNHGQSMDLFRFNWGIKGSSLDCKPAGFAAFPENGNWCHYTYRANIKPYQYYDENGQFQSLTLPGANADPTINEKQASPMIYPGSATQEVDMWFAFDRTPAGMMYTMGTGEPVTENDFANDAVKGCIKYQKNVVTSPYLRNFAFSADDSTAYVYNIESRYLNPAKKFCTPPFLRGKFLFWRPEWEVQSPDSFTITFKARGKIIHVGLSSKLFSDRIVDGAPFNTAHDYAIRANTSGVITMEKNLSGSATITSTAATNAFGQKTNISGNIQQLPLKVSGSLPQTDSESYNDYWLSYSNGVISFGTGASAGQNIVAQGTDSTPVGDITSFCFSSDMRTTDYIDITAGPYGAISIQAPNATPGTYAFWNQAQQFAIKGHGAFCFSYRIDPSAALTPATSDASAPSSDSNTIVMIGLHQTLPAAGTTLIPTYQIMLGTHNNTAHEIIAKSNSVNSVQSAPNADGITPPIIITTDHEWHDIWVAYDNGTIAYGSGTKVGQNLMAYWQDTTTPVPAGSPIKNINSFSFTSPTNALNFRFNNLLKLAPHKTYTAPANGLATWLPLWQFTTPNQGVITFTTHGATGATPTIALLNIAQALSSPSYEIVINDNNTAYIRKERTQIKETIASLQSAQVPASSGTTYWTAWHNGLFILGTGANPLDLTTIILKWQDPAIKTDGTATQKDGYLPMVKRFALWAANKQVTYKNITVLSPDAYAATFTAVRQSLAPTVTT